MSIHMQVEKFFVLLETCGTSRRFFVPARQFTALYSTCADKEGRTYEFTRGIWKLFISVVILALACLYTVGSRFATFRFTTIQFYDPCRVGPSTPDLWCITVATQASFLYLMRFLLFSGVHVFLLFLF